MSCVRCGSKETPCLAALTPNVHERLCLACDRAWVDHSRRTLIARNTHGAVLAAFRRWCQAGRVAA